jgi:putative toxin-antitoxin system antitoxin component (TIGR02293 family)
VEIVPAVDLRRFIDRNLSRPIPTLPSTMLGFDRLLRDGLPAHISTVAADQLGIGHEQLATLLHISRSTLDRHIHDKEPLRGSAANHLYRLLCLLVAAERALNDAVHVRAWMRRPLPKFGRRTPLEMLTTSAGLDAVMQQLDEIRFDSGG